MGQYQDPQATPYDFIYCHGYGCSQKLRVGLRKDEWRQIENIFKKTENAQAERQNIANAFALTEAITGKLAKTSGDLPYAPLIKQSDYELDCIDETVNSTKYLTFFKEADLLKFHDVGRPAFKGFFVDGVYPHNTATVIEKDTGKVYVIDSYIFANGGKPVIRTLEDWLKTKTF